jgi:predicted nucleotidyltransferase component of viral defense system
LIVEFPGVAPFVFPGIKVEEAMADKLLALAFRNNLSGRDIFDLWFHWFRHGSEGQSYSDIAVLLKTKMKQREVGVGEFNDKISSRLKDAIPARVIDEWNRYLTAGLKNKGLFEEIFATTMMNLEKIRL